ncbi:cupin, partial [Chloroflexota bacterium]
PPGIYPKGHYHAAGAVLVCIKGKGYSYNWHKDLGQRPWEAGKGHLVKVQEYIPGGLVAAAPGGGDWFYQHMGLGKGPALRVLNMWAGPTFNRAASEVPNPEDEIVSNNIYSPEEGGRSIHWRNEDPFIRKTYQERLEKEGVEFRMPEELYR